MNWKMPSCAVLFFILVSLFTIETNAQVFQRPRIAPSNSGNTAAQQQLSQSSPTGYAKAISISRPILTNQIVISSDYIQPSLVKKTSSAQPVNSAAANSYANGQYAAASAIAVSQKLRQAMDARIGIRYVYGSSGGNSYDCSGLVWSVFRDAGINFERSSARTYWKEFEPVSGDDRYKFGTLVFFNGLAHVGIVVDDKGFYQASSSKGVTYTPFAGYWENRIVGFRHIPVNSL